MKTIIILCLCWCTFAFSLPNGNSERTIPAFPIFANEIELTRPAQPGQYFDKIGRKAGMMGLESGQFEMWIWPWKPLRNFDLQFFLSSSTQPILSRDIVRTISVTPEVTTLTFTYESFTVKEHIIVPRSEPGAILLLEVHTTQPLSIIPGFIPVLQPMWPAGIGGQYSYWNDDVNGYVISEGQKRASIICGSPAAKQMAAPPAHMFGDNPMQFRIDVLPGETEGKYIPIVIAGANPDTVTWKMNFDSVKATYEKLWRHANEYYLENRRYYQELSHTTLQIETPDPEINIAYEWGKIALDNLMVENPRLGYGMVAGFGLSGGGGRPGFAWFFGGDAFINVLAMNSAGMYQQARDALAFTQKWQRQENYPIRKTKPKDPPKDVGKMAHELSQSDGLCDWWNDYRYGYNHADTSPWYLVAMGDYVRSSGDIDFLKKSWQSVKQAYTWCLSKDSDSDGLMDLNGAGLGALEFGKLVGIYADVYTCGVFVQGMKEVLFMAEIMGEKAFGERVNKQYLKAKARLEEIFWLENEGYYAYGATEQGEKVKEKTPWPGTAMMFGLLDDERTARSIVACNSADLCTDWGVRTLSKKSELFDPSNYNYGAVWPFIGTFFNNAQFKHHFTAQGYELLRANIKHVTDHGLGVVPEVFSGEFNEKLAEGYHHQGFSTTGYMLPLVRGLLGLEVDALKKHITFQPHFPEWRTTHTVQPVSVQLKNIAVSNSIVHATISSEKINKILEVRLKKEQGEDVHCTINLAVPHKTTLQAYSGESTTTLNPVSVEYDQDLHYLLPAITIPESEHTTQEIVYVFTLEKGIQFSHSTGWYKIGEGNRGVKILSNSMKNDTLYVTVEGLSGERYALNVNEGGERNIRSVEGAAFANGTLSIEFEKAVKQEFLRKTIKVIVR